MSFNSPSFVLLFLPTVLLLYYAKLDGFQPRIFLLLFSLIFYGIAQPGCLPLLAVSILGNYVIARRIQSSLEDTNRCKRWLTIGLALNVAFLGWFKYLDFLFPRFTALSLIRAHLEPTIFPLGISFFTLQQIMYLVDCYENLIPANGLIDHSAFVSFFPYITAGPITRSQQVVPQVQAEEIRNPDYDNLARGMMLFVLGLSKKVIVADSLAFFVSRLSEASGLYLLDAWAVTIGYTLQIYFDFSGYSDMAQATALMLNVRIPRNFNSPYRSLSIAEFWQRWHITLSQFITTYLYTPMVRSLRQVNVFHAVVVSLVTMFVVGLWHGPSWTFGVFGALHGLGLGINQIWRKSKRKLPIWLAWALTFMFVNIAFVFFRSSDLSDAIRILAVMSGASVRVQSILHYSFTVGDWLLLTCSLGLACFGSNSNKISEEFRPSWRNVISTTALALACLIYLNSTLHKGFIYRDF